MSVCWNFINSQRFHLSADGIKRLEMTLLTGRARRGALTSARSMLKVTCENMRGLLDEGVLDEDQRRSVQNTHDLVSEALNEVLENDRLRWERKQAKAAKKKAKATA